MRLLVYEGVRVEFYPTSDVASSDASSGGLSPADSITAMANDVKARGDRYREESYLASRATAPIKKETAVPTELPEVVNLARDYDRWDHYEAPPPLED